MKPPFLLRPTVERNGNPTVDLPVSHKRRDRRDTVRTQKEVWSRPYKTFLLRSDYLRKLRSTIGVPHPHRGLRGQRWEPKIRVGTEKEGVTTKTRLTSTSMAVWGVSLLRRDRVSEDTVRSLVRCKGCRRGPRVGDPSWVRKGGQDSHLNSSPWVHTYVFVCVNTYLCTWRTGVSVC